jgi:mRNA interferase MazF
MTDQVKALDLTVRNAEFVEKIPSDILYEICDIVGGFTEIEEI